MSTLNREEVKAWMVVEYNPTKDEITAIPFGEMLDRNVSLAIEGKDPGRFPLAMTSQRQDLRNIMAHVKATVNARRKAKTQALQHVRKLTIPDEQKETENSD